VDSIDSPALPAEPAPSLAAFDDASVLDALRGEQAKLKREYERMEAKLRAMESRLTTRAQAALDGDEPDGDAPDAPPAPAAAQPQAQGEERVPVEAASRNGAKPSKVKM